jgi:Glycosyl transferases group 1
LKILYVCWLDPATTDLPLFLANAWETEGHEVCLFPYDLEFSNTAPGRLIDSAALHIGNQAWRFFFFERKIVSKCHSFKPDILLLGHPFIRLSRFRQIREKLGCLLGYFIGYNNLLERRVAQYLSASDFVLVHDSYLIPLLQGTRYNRCPHVFLIPALAEPKEHHPIIISEEERQRYGGDIAFIGGVSPNRIAVLSTLKNKDLRIWGGPTWKNVPYLSSCFRDEPVYGLKKSKIYNAASVTLNIEDDEKQVNAISQRVPEVIACGGFVITDWHKDLEKTGLVEGESIVSFRSPGELQEKVMHYLSRPGERKRISQNGRQIVAQGLTYCRIAPLIIQAISEIGQRGENP